MGTEATYERVFSWRVAAIWLALGAIAFLGSFLLGRLLVSPSAHRRPTATLTVLPTAPGVPSSLAATPPIVTFSQIKPLVKRRPRVPAGTAARESSGTGVTTETKTTPAGEEQAAPTKKQAPTRPAPTKAAPPAPRTSTPKTFDSSE